MIFGVSIDSNLYGLKNVPYFLQCFYLSVITFFTLGYGDVTASGTESIIVAILEVITGALYVAVITATFYKKISG